MNHHLESAAVHVDTT